MSNTSDHPVYRKVTTRLVPFLLLAYVVAYLDRVNVGFAKLQMQSDLNFSDAAYAFGASIFFVGYFLFEVPSNLFLHRFGARKWIARIMVTWGVVSIAMMLVKSETTFYILRFLLGVFEAGFFPGVILYLTYWYPKALRTRIVAKFMVAIALSSVIGGPLSGWIMTSMAGVNGWTGWQWLFLLEGLPSILVGVITWFYLDDSIDQARWLTAGEKAVLHANLQADEPEAATTHHGVAAAFRNAQVWLLGSAYFCCGTALYGIGFWMPQLIKDTGVTDTLLIGMYSAIPWGIAVVSMLAWSAQADRSGKPRLYAAMAYLVCAVGLLGMAMFTTNTLLALIAMTIAVAGVMSEMPPFWSHTSSLFVGVAAAAGIAWVNSLGALGSFTGTNLVALASQWFGTKSAGLYLLAALQVLGAVLVLAARHRATAPQGVKAAA